METVNTHAIATKVAALLGKGWKAVADDEHPANHSALVNMIGMKISIRYTGGKFSCSCWNWPSYTTMERGETKRVTIWPRDLRDSQSGPSINVSASRGAQVLAAEISRRILPEYQRIWDLCSERARQAQEYGDNSRALWERVCKKLGVDSKHERHYNITGAISIEHRGESIHIDGYVTEDFIDAIIAAAKSLAAKP